MSNESQTAISTPIVPLASLPVVIDAPGAYMTRDGRRVTVIEEKGTGTFCWRGHIWDSFRGKQRPRHFKIWHPSGRTNPLHERKADIVSTWTPQA